MRSRRKKPRRTVNTGKITANENARRDYEAQIQGLYDSFEDIDPDDVRATVHPFETAGLCDKPLSVVQKAITYVIIRQGGAATETEILAFLRKYWTQIIPRTDHQSRQIPDKRALHINFSIQKEKRFLFVRSPESSEKWILNTTKAPMEPNRRITEQIIPFQERMLSLLRHHDGGMTLEEIIEATKEYAGLEGLFPNLPLAKRVKVCLTAKRAIREIWFDEKHQKWIAYGQGKNDRPKRLRTDDFSPIVMKGMHVRDLSINELWNVLKEKGVYADRSVGDLH
jgi:hypothetical protein